MNVKYCIGLDARAPIIDNDPCTAPTNVYDNIWNSVSVGITNNILNTVDDDIERN